jgi:hypothetical protein
MVTKYYMHGIPNIFGLIINLANTVSHNNSGGSGSGGNNFPNIWN